MNRIPNLNWTGDHDGTVYPGASLMMAIQKFHDREQRCRAVRRFGVIGYETATRIAFQNLDSCCATDPDSSTDEGDFCERSVRKIKMKVGPKTPGIQWLTEFSGKLLDGL